MLKHKSLMEQYVEMSRLPDDIQTRYNYQMEQTRHEMYDRYEREQLKKEIIDEIMSHIDVLLETEAIQKLEDMINRLGK